MSTIATLLKQIGIIAVSGTLMAAFAATSAFAQQASPTVGVTLSFEVVTEGEVSEDTTFFGLYGVPNSEFSAVQLTDPDGDSVYTGAVALERGQYVVRIDQGTGTQETVYGTFPGEPSSIIQAQETITLTEDRTISTRVDFGSEPDNGSPSPGEVIYGTEGPDYLTDTQGDDVVYALGGGDTISAGYGNDALYGGYGWDYVVGGYGDDALYGWEGSDWLDGGAGNDYVSGWTGDDRVDGGTGHDVVFGDTGNDALYGYSGYDTLYGWEGFDFIYSAGDGTYDRVFGGPGYDVCVVGPEDYVVGCEEVYTG